MTTEKIRNEAIARVYGYINSQPWKDKFLNNVIAQRNRRVKTLEGALKRLIH